MRRANSVALAALALSACCHSGRFATDVPVGTPLARIDRDEHVETWLFNGARVCGKSVEAADGCYVVEAKYSAQYLRERGVSSFVWPVVGLVGTPAAIGAAAHAIDRTHLARYESDVVPFALTASKQYTYYVTSTFTGDQFIPRIVESNAAGERIREITPAKAVAELEACQPGWSSERSESGGRAAASP